MSTHYLGMGGQLAVMAELAARGYNVAIPQIDVGDDVFVVNDATGAMWRIQVKTATATESRRGFRAQFRIRANQVERAVSPELHYAFVIRFKSRWRFVVISRDVLHNYVRQGMGTRSNDHIQLYFSYSKDANGVESIVCSGQNLLHHRNDWARWTPL